MRLTIRCRPDCCFLRAIGVSEEVLPLSGGASEVV